MTPSLFHSLRGALLASLVAAAALPPAASASAAVIETSGEIDGMPVITLDGEMQLSDLAAFQSIANRYSRAIVAFRSNGGELRAGLGIGTAIREKGFRTFVPSESRCASACAIAWLAGSPRMVAPRAQIGFHAAYRVQDGKASETGAGNALVGAYLNRLSLSDRAVVFITQAPPASLNWLTPARAADLGIEIETASRDVERVTAGDLLFGRPREPRPTTARPPAAPPAPDAAPAGDQAAFRSAHADWRLYVAGSGGRKSCHLVPVAASEPPGQSLSVTISRRPAEKVPHEVAVTAEVPLRQGPGGVILIDEASYPLTVKGRNAWPRRADEAEIMVRLGRASSFTAVLHTPSGERLEQRYSLEGLNLALGQASAECP